VSNAFTGSRPLRVEIVKGQHHYVRERILPGGEAWTVKIED